ncbi:DUF2169 domain-containing protein [Sorangium sp. So ce887]|uniref:DUF2169 family type VI secretion system accessory protein n=1 Tax=Sorangium sp. So ce887 TaxID=3133324 RepID=UPI003F615599
MRGVVGSAIAPDQVLALPGATAAAVAWRSRGQLNVTVIAKATFAFAPDAEMPRGAPQPIFAANVHHDGDPLRSVRFTSDLAPYLGRADALFTGHACAPPGTSVLSLPVRLAIFDRGRAVLDKGLLVQDRAPFQSLPIVYERAHRGADGQENPLGVDPKAGKEQATVLDPARPQRPAGYGPIAGAWPARKRLLGNTSLSALEGPVHEIPEPFDWSYFQAAPPDQWIDHLRGGEWLVLHGLHPTVPHLKMRLPEARGLARIHGLAAFGVEEGQPLALHADTLRIDGEEQRCALVFRRSFPVPSEAALARVRVVAGVEQPGAPLEWPTRLEDRAPPSRGAAPPSRGAAPPEGAVPAVGAIVVGATGRAPRGLAAAAMTTDIAEGALEAALRSAHPFRPQGAPLAVAIREAAPAPPQQQDAGASAPGSERGPAPLAAIARPRAPRWVATTQDVPDLSDEAPSSARALPFQEPPPGAAPALLVGASAPRARIERVATGTLEVSVDEPAGAELRSALPFTGPGVAPAAPPAAAPPGAAEGAALDAPRTEGWAAPAPPQQQDAGASAPGSERGPAPLAAIARPRAPRWVATTQDVPDLSDEALSSARALPFQEPPPGAAPALLVGASAPRARIERVATGTLEVSVDEPAGAELRSALPFTGPGVAPAAPPAATPPGAADDPALDAPRTEGWAAPAPEQYIGWPADPPLLGPVAERAQAAQGAPSPAPGTVPYFEPAAPVSTAAPLAAAPAPEPAPPDPDPASFSLERFAAVTAELAAGRAPRAAVLASHALGERAWSAIDRHWADAIKKDAAHGAGRLRSAYDSAYVATVERFRGPLTPAEYARLVVAVERKQSDRVLDELRIQRPALMHVMRVWTKKAAADPRLFGEVSAALASLRAQ